MPELRLIGHGAVLDAISPAAAIDCVRRGFEHYATGEWRMPSKVYLDAPPGGDFRAMPALGGGLAIVKWITSFPGNPERGLPTVTGVIVVSNSENGEPLAMIDARAVTALRTGAAAAIASRAIAREDAETVGIIGCGLHGRWVARCMAAAGYDSGICFDMNASNAQSVARELGWTAGSREAAVGCDIVCTVTPANEPVIDASDLHAGQHINALGADGPGKSELTPAALARCTLFCDEWDQAAHGGEITPAVEAGLVTRGDVIELGWMLTGATGKRDPEAITLFDSTGLAIQDLAICTELTGLLDAGKLDASVIQL
ncbi:MAG TPA: ornithine cyclodeaminase family protein [Solirubrobacterales bacterium]|jgi:ornithine cyclodeaminase/alanine dehydrogenase-like protein (mu-crystallin family)|nr:ornithine cyclodeaminase family protein [Solirubrobacterales bacterium]